jgi:succinoglycan biosynthesis protein ExoA
VARDARGGAAADAAAQQDGAGGGVTVLQLVSSEGYYGIETMLVSLAETLERLGCGSIVGVLCDSRSPHVEVADEALRRGLRVRVIPCRGRWDREAVRTLRGVVERDGADAIHAHGYKADFYAWAAARGSRTALVATCHNWPNKRPVMRAYAGLDRLVLRRFDAVAAVSPTVAALLGRWGVKAREIANGVDVGRFRSAEPALRREVAGAGDLLVGFVGRLVAAKGGAVLLEAAARVLADAPEARFVFVGDGEARGEWQELAARLRIGRSVVFTGVRRDMPEVYASLDVMVLPSLDEAMPMCVLEAMAAGVPVVATRVGAVPGLVVPGETGELVEPGDRAGLAAAILRLLRDRAEARRLGENGRALVIREHSVEATAREYLALYPGKEVRERSGAPGSCETIAGDTPAAALRCVIRAGSPERPRIVTQRPVPFLSVVVPCRNERGHIREFLDSLRAQEMGGFEWEAIVADGMSDDGTRAALEEYSAAHPEVSVVSNPGRIVSTGLNAAIRAARGNYILRMDVHTTYAPDYCRRSVETLERTGADNAGGPARTRASGLVARAIAAAYHSRFSTGGGKFHDEDYEGWVDTVPFGCWRKSTLEKLGLFDETLVRNQDDELNLRLLRRGGRIWQDPQIRCWYSPRPTLGALFRQYMQYGYWKVAVIRKHRLPGSWRHLAPVAFIVGNLGLPAIVVAAAVSGAREVATAAAAVWLGLAVAYVAANLAASLVTARRRGWETLPYLPAVFAAYHVSYGLGFFAGLLRFARSGERVGDSAFTRITR